VLLLFLGLCPFFDSRNIYHCVWFGVSAIVVLFISTLLGYAVQNALEAINLSSLFLVVYILLLYVVIELLENLSHKYLPEVYMKIGQYFPVLKTNCLTLGVIFFFIMKKIPFGEAMVSSIGAGVGFLLALLLMTALRSKADILDIPKPFKGLPSYFFIAGILSMIFIAFRGG